MELHYQHKVLLLAMLSLALLISLPALTPLTQLLSSTKTPNVSKIWDQTTSPLLTPGTTHPLSRLKPVTTVTLTLLIIPTLTRWEAPIMVNLPTFQLSPSHRLPKTTHRISAPKAPLLKMLP